MFDDIMDSDTYMKCDIYDIDDVIDCALKFFEER